MENLRLIIPSVSLSLILHSCTLCDGKEYGVDFNSVRENLGLVKLKKDTQLNTEEGCSSTWLYKNQNVHREKIIKLDSYGSIQSEEDLYYLGTKSFADPDQSTPTEDYIRIIYSFEDNEWTVISVRTFDGLENYNVQTKILNRHIDFLHFKYDVEWDHLPTVDTTLFPLKQGN